MQDPPSLLCQAIPWTSQLEGVCSLGPPVLNPVYTLTIIENPLLYRVKQYQRPLTWKVCVRLVEDQAKALLVSCVNGNLLLCYSPNDNCRGLR